MFCYQNEGQNGMIEYCHFLSIQHVKRANETDLSLFEQDHSEKPKIFLFMGFGILTDIPTT